MSERKYTRIWRRNDATAFLVGLDATGMLVDAAGPVEPAAIFDALVGGAWDGQEGVAEQLRRDGALRYEDITQQIVDVIKEGLS